MVARLGILAVVLALSASSCCQRQEGPAENEERIRAVVSILPQKCFVKKVGGDHVNVSILVGPGKSPATYEPTPKQMAVLQEADVLFRIGVPFEKALMPRVREIAPHLRIVDTREGIDLRTMDEGHLHGHEAEPPDGEAHDPAAEETGENGDEGLGGRDPHIWLDPILVKRQARTICDALKKIAPRFSAEFESNLAAFQAELDSVHKDLAETLAPLKGREVFVYHPSYGYFADRYGLEQVAVETGGKEPGARRLSRLIEMAKERDVKVIFVQKQFAGRSANAVADAINGTVVRIDPLAEDYLQNLRAIARKLRDGLEGK